MTLKPHTPRARQDLNKAYKPGQFNLAYQYAAVLTMVFSCVALSAGMPLLTLLLVVFLYVRFHSVKTNLLRYWERPRRYDEELKHTIVEF